MTQPTTSPTTKTRTKGRTRALLAGGLVAILGIGGTLAAWNTSVAGRTLASGGGGSTQPEPEPEPGTHVMQLKSTDGVWLSNDGTHDRPGVLIASPELPTQLSGARREVWSESAARVKGAASDGDAYKASVLVTYNASYLVGAGGTVEAIRTYGQSGFFAHPDETRNQTCEQIPTSRRIGSYQVSRDASRATVEIPSAKTNEELRICMLTYNSYTGPLTRGDLAATYFTFDAEELG